MRRYDIDIAEENVAGELMDVQAGFGLPDEIDPIETAHSLRRRYESLWSELTHEETFGADERHKIDARLRRLNDLGFDVDEMELITSGDGYRLRMHTQVVEPGHHRRRLLMLTGLDVQENQARRLLYDISSFRQSIERKQGRPVPESVVAYRWLSEVFEPTIAAIPDELRGKFQPAEVYHQVLEHRWFMSELEDKDVGLRRALRSYVTNVLRHVPDEVRVLSNDEDDEGEDPQSTSELPAITP